jgi:hypothetical protein
VKGDWHEALAQIGKQLGESCFPNVTIGGIVLPGNSSDPISILGKEKSNVSSRERSAEARSGPTPSSSPGGPRPSSSAPQVEFASFRTYEADLAKLRDAYPQVAITQQSQGMWLRLDCQLLEGFPGRVTFLVACFFLPEMFVRAWAYWTTPFSAQWIGPRHTNYPDGSICAFFPADNTWVPGDSLIALLDLYVLWAIRHLHLKTFGYWPGPQHSSTVGERKREFKDGELCGCDNPRGTYEACCKSGDNLPDLPPSNSELERYQGAVVRRPPKAVDRYVRGLSSAPGYRELENGIIACDSAA